MTLVLVFTRHRWAPLAAILTPFSWTAAAFEVVADLAIGLAGMYVLRSRRQTAPSKAAPAA